MLSGTLLGDAVCHALNNGDGSKADRIGRCERAMLILNLTVSRLNHDAAQRAAARPAEPEMFAICDKCGEMALQCECDDPAPVTPQPAEPAPEAWTPKVGDFAWWLDKQRKVRLLEVHDGWAVIAPSRGSSRSVLLAELCPCPDLRPIPPAAADAPAEASPDAVCNDCIRCLLEKKTSWGTPVIGSRMIVCVTCGNKRCPKATDCRLECTGSNEPGQKGSEWENYPRPHPIPPAAEAFARSMPRYSQAQHDAALAAEYRRGLEDAAAVCGNVTYATHLLGSYDPINTSARTAARRCASAIRALAAKEAGG